MFRCRRRSGRLDGGAWTAIDWIVNEAMSEERREVAGRGIHYAGGVAILLKTGDTVEGDCDRWEVVNVPQKDDPTDWVLFATYLPQDLRFVLMKDAGVPAEAMMLVAWPFDEALDEDDPEIQRLGKEAIMTCLFQLGLLSPDAPAASLQ